MSRYIDVDNLLLRIDCHGTNKFGMLDEDIRDFILKMPTADVVSVVRCKDCKYFQYRYVELPDGSKRPYKKGESIVPLSVGINVGSYCTRIDYAIVHGYRNGEPSVDETRLWTKPDDFCSYGERLTERVMKNE